MPKSKRSPNWGGKRTGAGPKIQNLKLSVNESLLIVDAFNGTLIDENDPILPESVIWQEIEDACHLDHLDQKWSVDGVSLVGRLKKIDHATAVDLLAKIQKFWGDSYHVDNSEKRVKDIGLASE